MNDWRLVSRQAVWDEYRLHPESRTDPGRYQSAPNHSQGGEPFRYWFTRVIRVVPGDDAGTMVDLANSGAAAAVAPAKRQVKIGSALMAAGALLCLICVFGGGAKPMLFVAGFPLFVWGGLIVRKGTDAGRTRDYNRRFAQDVERYARAVLAKTPP